MAAKNGERGIRDVDAEKSEMASRQDFVSLLRKNSTDKPFINYFSTENVGLSITFGEFLNLTDKIDNFLSKLLDGKFEFIGVKLNDYLWLPCLLTSIWKLGKACACIGTQYSQDCNLNFLIALRIKYLITDDEKSCFAADLVETFQINDRRFYVWKTKTISDSVSILANEPIDICYGIMTSGSTGSPKIIQVPWSCILPNVCELVNLFSVNERDNVYLSSPYTFDPFFVELFMSFNAGCTLTIVSSHLKMCPKALLKIFFGNHKYALTESQSKDISMDFHCKTTKIEQTSVSIIQMTPSIFKRWGLNSIEDIILAEESSLRILLLGGEKFPTDILKLKSKKNRTKIYNMYGITEISCWAFVKHVTDDATLGHPLSDIFYKVDDLNELLIGSRTRRCFIDNEKHVESDEIVYRRTGDVVTVNNSEIYFISRTNQIVKKFGIKINLEHIENVFLNLHNQCFCIFDDSTMKLALFYVNDDLNEAYRVINGHEITGLNLRSIEVPDFIIEIPKIPLNSNGKCDKMALLELFREITQREEGVAEDAKIAFERVWTTVVGERNFVRAGGDSVKALQLITKLEEAGIEVPKKFLTTLLADGDYRKCLNYVGNKVEFGNKRIKLEKSYEFSIFWTYDTMKCVDATPAVFDQNGEVHAVVGSHSSRLSSVKVDTGQENWTINLTNRIESGFSVNGSSTFGLIGCYDRHVYCLSTKNGRILWKYETEGMIKSTPCLSSNEEIVYVASYDTFLYCLKCRDGTLVSRLKLSDRGIYSSGIVSHELGAFFIGTLDGSCLSVNQKSNEIDWKHRLDSPIFASPVVVVRNLESFVIFTEVVGRLICFDAGSGNKVAIFTFSYRIVCQLLNDF